MYNDPNEFFIEFDTQSNSGKLGAVRIRIDYVEIDDMNQSLNINLIEHPLYPNLVRYVEANK